MDNNILGQNIAARREQLGLYQQDVAERVNVTRQAVSAWENGKTEPSIGMIEKLAALFNCKKSDLLENTQYDRDYDYIAKLPDGSEMLVETHQVKYPNSRMGSGFDKYMKHQEYIDALIKEDLTDISTSEMMLIKYYRKLTEQDRALALADIIKKSVSEGDN